MVVIEKNLSDQIYSLIKEKILDQEYKLGEKINTKKIANDNNISVMPVRDALNHLEDNGLVQKRPRVGYFVRSFSVKEIKDIMEMRKIYELYSLNNRDNIDLNKLKTMLKDMKDKRNKLTRSSFDKLDYSFHDYFISLSNNDLIHENYNEIKELIELFRRLDKDRIEEANEEHIEIIETIIDGDIDAAKRKLKNHVNIVTNSLIEMKIKND